ncbi:MAG TPA: VWA domain-containing protein [Thermoanaerobaculia bacterium]|nr:VWA domain-containing protein [Thermoanaerobaculia bacterium]
MNRKLLVLGILLAFALAVQAQKTEAVDVPVFVSHGDKPVEGLTRDDFELYVNGERQLIDDFDVISPASERTLRDRRLFLLIFDGAFSRPQALIRGQKAAASLIASAPESDRFAVATFTSGEGVQFAVPFTADRAALQRAIASLTVTKSGDPLAIVMTPAERASIDAMMNKITSQPEITSRSSRDMASEQVRRRAERQIEVLERLSQRLASLDGQKHVVLMTEGFAGYSDMSPFALRRRAGENDPVGAVAEPHFYTALKTMHRAFQQADVFLHTLDLKGVQTMPVIEDAHHLLATATGGEAMTDDKDVTRSLSRLSTHLRARLSSRLSSA